MKKYRLICLAILIISAGVCAKGQSNLPYPVICLQKADHTQPCSMTFNDATGIKPLFLGPNSLNAGSTGQAFTILGSTTVDGRIVLTPGPSGLNYVQSNSDVLAGGPGLGIGRSGTRWPFGFFGALDASNSSLGTPAGAFTNSVGTGLSVTGGPNVAAATIVATGGTNGVAIIAVGSGPTGGALEATGDVFPSAGAAYNNGEALFPWAATYTGTLNASSTVVFTSLSGGGTRVVCANNLGLIQAGTCGSSGSVTSISTTAPLTGGPITTTGTLSCADCMTLSTGQTVTGVKTWAASQLMFADNTYDIGTTTTAIRNVISRISSSEDVLVGAGGTNFASHWDFKAGVSSFDLIDPTSSYNQIGITKFAAHDTQISFYGTLTPGDPTAPNGDLGSTTRGKWVNLWLSGNADAAGTMNAVGGYKVSGNTVINSSGILANSFGVDVNAGVAGTGFNIHGGLSGVTGATCTQFTGGICTHL